MKIVNLNKNFTLAEEVFLADNFQTRTKGLLGRKSLLKGHAMILRPCNSVHTFFMQFPIDVLFIDKDNRVIKIVRFMGPFKATWPCLKAKFVVELPVGTIDASKTTLGDTGLRHRT